MKKGFLLMLTLFLAFLCDPMVADEKTKASLSVRLEGGQILTVGKNTKLIFEAKDAGGNPLNGKYDVTLDNYVGSGYVTDGLVLWLDGQDAPVDGKWFDRSGNQHYLTLSDGVTYDEVNRSYNFKNGVTGITDVLDYKGSYATTVQFVDQGGSMSTATSSYVFSSGKDNTVVGYWGLYRDSASILRFYGANPSNNTYVSRTDLPAEKGESASYTIVHDRKRLVDNYNLFYKNGSLITKVSSNERGDLGKVPLANFPLMINGNGVNTGNRGGINLSSVRIYNRPLSEAEILQNQKADALRFHIGSNAEKETYGHFGPFPLDGSAVTSELEFVDGKAEAEIILTKGGSYNLQFRMNMKDGSFIVGGSEIGTNDPDGAVVSGVDVFDASGTLVSPGAPAAVDGYQNAPSLSVNFSSTEPGSATYKWFKTSSYSYLAAEACGETKTKQWQIPLGLPRGTHLFFATVTTTSGSKEVTTLSPIVTVRIGSGNMDIFSNGNKEGADVKDTLTNTYLYKNSTLQEGSGNEKSLWDFYGLNEDGELNSPYLLPVLNDQELGDVNNYKNFAKTDWLFQDGYMPYLKRLYDAENDYKDLYSTINTPNWKEQSEVTMEKLMSERSVEASLSLMVDGMSGVLPEAYAMASGADSINIELDEPNEIADMVVSFGEQIIYEGKAALKVMTFGYDYQSDVKVSFTSLSGETKEFTFSKEELSHTVMVDGDHYYYLSKDGILSDQGLLNEKAIHLYRGFALNEKGEIVNLETLEKVKAALNGEALPIRPLYVGEVDGKRIENYQNFARIGDVTRDLKVFLHKKQLFVLDPRLPVDTNRVIADHYLGKSYLTVLGNDGMLQNLQEEIVLPEDFMNAGIIEISSTLNTEQPWILVRYSNQNIDGFNYLTGERLDVERKEFDSSFIEFVEDFFSSKKEPILGSLKEGYLQIIDLEKQLLVYPNLDELLYATKGNGKTEESDTTVPPSSIDEIDDETSEGTEVEGEGVETDGEGEKVPSGTHEPEGVTTPEEKETSFVKYYDASRRSYQLVERGIFLNADKEDMKTMEELAEESGDYELLNTVRCHAQPLQERYNLDGIGMFLLPVAGILILLIVLVLLRKSKQQMK